jgi:hypothetical protein
MIDTKSIDGDIHLGYKEDTTSGGNRGITDCRSRSIEVEILQIKNRFCLNASERRIYRRRIYMIFLV